MTGGGFKLNGFYDDGGSTAAATMKIKGHTGAVYAQMRSRGHGVHIHCGSDPGGDSVRFLNGISTDSQFLVIWIAGYEKVGFWIYELTSSMQQVGVYACSKKPPCRCTKCDSIGRFPGAVVPSRIGHGKCW